MNDLAYLIRQMKAPRIAPRPGPRGRQAASRVAEQARNESWSYEDFLTVLLEQEVLARQAQGGEARIRAARFAARKTVEDFDFSYQTSVRQQVVLHLATLSFIEARDNVIFLGPPGTGNPAPGGQAGDPLGRRPRNESLFSWPARPVCHGDPVGDEKSRQPITRSIWKPTSVSSSERP